MLAAAVDGLPSLAIGTAGGSALREYERRHAARERRARERAGIVGVWWTRLTGDPLSTRSWKQGGEGEVKVAGRLAKLLDGSGVYLLHDRLAPSRRKANIDHIAVGPGGVTVIDAKTISGKVRVESIPGVFGQRRQLRVNGRDRTWMVYGVRAQAESVRALLNQHGLAGEVRCALCLANADGLPLLRQLELEGVTIGGPWRVAKLAQRSGPLSETEVHQIVRLLVACLPAA
jgi:Nuclease-related domain